PHPRALAAARRAGVRAVTVLTDDGPDLELLARLADEAGVWVDGLTGIGARGPLRSALATIVSHLVGPRASLPDEPIVVAVDLPSGIDADRGTVPGAVLAADVTVSLGAAKPGVLAGPGVALVGRLVHV